MSNVGISLAACRVCGGDPFDVPNNAIQHLLSRRHQRLAATAVKDSERCLLVNVTEQFRKLSALEVLRPFTALGVVSDFRFIADGSSEQRLRPGSTLMVQYEGDGSEVAMKSGLALYGEQVPLVRPVAENGTQARAQKRAGGAGGGGGCRDPVHHDRLLTELGRQSLHRSTDQLMAWLCERLLLPPDQHQLRIWVCRAIQEQLRFRFPSCRVQGFGSSVSGLGFRGCDLDIYAAIDDPILGTDQAGQSKKVRLAAALMRDRSLFQHVIRITQARVPIVKFVCPRLGYVSCDLSFKNALSSQNSRLIAWMVAADERARLLAVSARYWAKRRNLAGGDHNNHKLSSYCLTLLVISFLQQLQPPVLPSVAWCQSEVPELEISGWNGALPAAPAEQVWSSSNTAPASQLLLELFRFLASLDKSGAVVCPLLGGCVPRALLESRQTPPVPQLERYWRRLEQPGEKPLLGKEDRLVVQDPFELSHNVAGYISEQGFNRFVACCIEAQAIPFVELFEEQELPKMKKKKRKAKAVTPAVQASEAAAVPSAQLPGPAAPAPAVEVSAAAVAMAAAAAVAQSRAQEAVTQKGSDLSRKRECVTSGIDSQARCTKSPRVAGPAQEHGSVAKNGVDTARAGGSDAAHETGSRPECEVSGDSENSPMGLSSQTKTERAQLPSPVVGTSDSTEARPSVPTPPSQAGSSDAAPSGAPAATNGSITPKVRLPKPIFPVSMGSQVSTVSADAGWSGAEPAVPDSVMLRDDPELLQQALTQFGIPPSRVLQLALPQLPRADAGGSRRAAAAALARLLQAVFTNVLQFDTVAVSFCGLDGGQDVVAGWRCRVHCRIWDHRRAVAAELARRRRDLSFEREVTRRVRSRMAQTPAAGTAATCIAELSCYLVLDGEKANLCYYEGTTAKLGNGCHDFLAKYLPELSRRDECYELDSL